MADVEHSTLDGVQLHFAKLRVAAGDPNGVATSSISGEAYFDTNTSILYVSTAADNSSWAPIIGSNSTELMTVPVASAVNDLVYITANDTVSKAGKEINKSADGIIIYKPSTTTGIVAFGSHCISGLTALGFSAGPTGKLYLGDSTTTPNITDTPPIAASGETQQELGWMINGDRAKINIDQGDLIK